MSNEKVNPHVLAAVHRAATRAGLKPTVQPDEIEDAVAAAGCYFEEATGRLLGADSVIKSLRKDKPMFFKNAHDLNDEEFAKLMRERGVRQRM